MFEVHVSKDSFKFNAAHFVAYPGFRERLHGHNYQVSVRLLGKRKIGPDGYVIDFGCIKEVTRKVCKELNEHFLCPTLSNVMEITVMSDGDQESVRLKCQDGSIFVFPKKDCAMIPIVHATTEELAIYLWGRILHGLDADYLLRRGIHTMEITCAEAVGQDATFRLEIPEDLEGHDFDVSQYIMSGDVVPMPCPSNPDRNTDAESNEKQCCGEGCCCSQSELSSKLQQLADMINSGKLQERNETLTAQDLEALLVTGNAI